LQILGLVLAAANHTRILRYYDLAPVDDGVEVCGAAPAAWTTKKSGVTYACRVLGFERPRRATATRRGADSSRGARVVGRLRNVSVGSEPYNPSSELAA
jgi:hypothetical protein